ncbi:LuxR C-terminal-related transcriptional regulator [Melittangium boletus]|uniref:LuxR C-terminal-related transcriptional regulator n=1 Tax=Melittangium boletus TaxID=83453 RepID=UPI003DA572D5
MTWEDMSAEEQSLVGKLLEELNQVQTLSELVRCAEAFLMRLLSADCMALCVSKPGPMRDYEWETSRLLSAFFARAKEWGPSDFVAGTVSREPGRVFRDQEMISREGLEGNAMYRLSHTLGTPLEQVMSVMLTIPGESWHGGFTAYRTRRQPFTERDEGLLQYVARQLASALHKCRMFMERMLYRDLFASIARQQGLALVVLKSSGEVLQETAPVAAVVRKWFPKEHLSTGLPRELRERCEALARGATGDTWTRENKDTREVLTVTFTALPQAEGPEHWKVDFRETRRSQLDDWLKELTRTETRAFWLLMQGKSNKEIAAALGNEVETVKKQVSCIYKKTGTSGRQELAARARSLGATVVMPPREEPE